MVQVEMSSGTSNKSSQTVNSMDPVHKPLCLHDDVTPDADDRPELAINRQWREEVRRARNEAHLSQTRLGEMVDSDQTQISRIESGDIASSKLVMPICKVLGIDPPEHFLDETARLWNRRMEIVRSSDSDVARAFLDAFGKMADALEEQQRQQTEPTPPEKPKKSS
jgi:ribosome-binding protein aMBF1 (putative translation factor)